jgi:hypothetical protein
LIWSTLHKELSEWDRQGLRLPIWWRDDDAVRPTRQLDRLADLSDHTGVPLHLAVIPATATPALGNWMEAHPVTVLVHGWSHADHASTGEKSSEFGYMRPDSSQDAARGLARLTGLYPDRTLPVFVPPWNRIAPGVAKLLPGLGYRGLSTYGPRHGAPAGLLQVNAHVDPVDWRGTRGLADPQTVLDRLVQNLRDRRAGKADADEPMGLLTHHLMQDDRTWAFCRDLLLALRDGPCEIVHPFTAEPHS